ncbi:MAG: hypothetical protein ACR2M4_08725 [Actinomycetota bacterium]
MPQHLKAFSSFFRLGTRSVASAAETYLLGLFASPKSNMLSMSERMLEAGRGKWSLVTMAWNIRRMAVLKG